MSEEYDLKKSTEKIGYLYPVILDAWGNPVDGFHRLAADPNWRKEVNPSLDTPEKIIKAKLIANKFRRQVTAEEVRSWINDLAEIALVEHGVQPGEISGWVAEETGYQQKTVQHYLDDKYKNQVSAEGGKIGSSITNIIRYGDEGNVVPSVLSVAEPVIREAEPTIDLETANGLTKAAKALEREAKRKVKAQKTPEQLAAEKAEKTRKKQEAAEKKQTEQAKKEKQLRERVRQEFTKEVKQEIKKEIKQDPKFKAEVIKEHQEKMVSETTRKPQITFSGEICQFIDPELLKPKEGKDYSHLALFPQCLCEKCPEFQKCRGGKLI